MLKISAINPKILVDYRQAKLQSIQIGKFAACAGDLSYIQIACVAVFVSLLLFPFVVIRKFKVRSREVGRARQTFQSGQSMAVFN